MLQVKQDSLCQQVLQFSSLDCNPPQSRSPSSSSPCLYLHLRLHLNLQFNRTRRSYRNIRRQKCVFIYTFVAFSLFGRRTAVLAEPLRAGAGAGFLDPVSESESQMDLSGFFAFGAGVFLGLGAASDGFLAATDHTNKPGR